LFKPFSHSLTGSVPEAVLKNLAGRIFIHILYYISNLRRRCKRQGGPARGDQLSLPGTTHTRLPSPVRFFVNTGVQGACLILPDRSQLSTSSALANFIPRSIVYESLSAVWIDPARLL
jgi:hypothetical protein